MTGLIDYPLIKLLLAVVLALPIAWHREVNSRIVGLRTFPLVSLASCAYTMIGLETFGADSEANARILQGLITGIGFVGGGAILKHDDHVTGTASATSIWVTGAVGASVAYGYVLHAATIAAFNIILIVLMSKFKTDE